jgi:hypothetical protein
MTWLTIDDQELQLTKRMAVLLIRLENSRLKARDRRLIDSKSCFRWVSNKCLTSIVEEELNLGEPKNLLKWMVYVWMMFGIWIFYKDFKKFSKKISEPIDGIDYDAYFQGPLGKKIFG